MHGHVRVLAPGREGRGRAGDGEADPPTARPGDPAEEPDPADPAARNARASTTASSGATGARPARPGGGAAAGRGRADRLGPRDRAALAVEPRNSGAALDGQDRPTLASQRRSGRHQADRPQRARAQPRAQRDQPERRGDQAVDRPSLAGAKAAARCGRARRARRERLGECPRRPAVAPEAADAALDEEAADHPDSGQGRCGA